MSIRLVHPLSGEEAVVSGTHLSEKCALVKERLVPRYAVKSSISIEVFRDFVSGLEGKEVAITTANFAGLSLLYDEFGLSARLSAFASTDGEARRRIAVLEKRALEWNRATAALQAEVARLSAAVESLRATVVPPAVAALPALPAGFASLIVPDFPPLLVEFQGKRFSLLWRGSRDGFGAKDFHSRCDGHANTLTLIRDTGGNIFGGFTPVDWESREWNWKRGNDDNGPKADPSLKSFIFTLKNPHNFPPRKFAMDAEEKEKAIRCDSLWGPHFCDIGVYDRCNTNSNSLTTLSYSSYTNDTGLDGKKFFTGDFYFKVSEIEVFEISD